MIRKDLMGFVFIINIGVVIVLIMPKNYCAVFTGKDLFC